MNRLNNRCFFVLFLLLGLTLLYTYGQDSFPAGRSKPAVNAAIAEFEPALAVRAPACITCHAKIGPGFITDFGHGAPYFFGKRAEGAKFGSFDGSVYGDFYGSEPNKTGWLTAEIGKTIVVPEALFDFSLTDAGAKLAAQPGYQQPLQATSLAGYLQALEKQKTNPARIIEKKKVFIGVPDAATLEARFNIVLGSGAGFKYIKTEKSSPAIEGIELNSSKSFYTNTREIVCDGDLFIRGTLFLNRGIISTNSGCRIYVTGPIFIQNGITYKERNNSGRANLQLVSADAILLGVGDKSCDSKDAESPLSRRLVSGYAVSTYFTRRADGQAMSPKAFGQSIYDKAKLIPTLEDASCQDDTTSFTRLLLNAPLVHSRYKGQFKGVVIAEVVLFRLSKSNFEFDPVFKNVPTLPALKDSDYLQVQ
jgi:hypothetical protein